MRVDPIDAKALYTYYVIKYVSTCSVSCDMLPLGNKRVN